MKNQFVFIKDNYDNSEKINQNEIGILIEEKTTTCIVNFINLNKDIEINKNLVEKFNPLYTGDQFEKKVCNICNRLLPVNEFAKNQNGKNNRTVRRPSCNDCRKIIDGENMLLKDKRAWEKVKPCFEIWECPICKKKNYSRINK